MRLQPYDLEYLLQVNDPTSGGVRDYSEQEKTESFLPFLPGMPFGSSPASFGHRPKKSAAYLMQLCWLL